MDIKLIIIIITIPIISGLIGWFTNYIAIKSLFRPLNTTNILGLKFQGLIPKRQKVISSRISKIIVDYLISNNDIILKFDDQNQIEKIKSKMIPILSSKIIDNIPMMFKSMAEPLIDKVLEKESTNIIKELGNELNNHLFENINIKDIITKRLEEYNTKNLEKIMTKIAREEFRHIEFLGFLIGFILGVLQVILFIYLN